MPEESLVQRRLKTVRGAVPQWTAVPKADDDALRRIRQSLYARIPPALLSRKSDPEAKRAVESIIREVVSQEGGGRLSRPALIRELLDDLLGYGPIQALIDDPEITEIMVNAPDKVYYEKGGVICLSEVKFRDAEHIRSVIEKIVGPVGRRIDESSPMVDARLPDGSRVNAVIPPVSRDGPVLTIRKFGRPLLASDLLSTGTLDERSLAFLGDCVKGKLNVLVSGGTGSGKTTLLNVLSSFIPDDQRVITIEDTCELNLQQPHVVRLEARQPNIEGKGEIPIRALVKNALRMRPDRIIVGEVRGGEALDMLQAMNTGHPGSMTTLHANSTQDALSRLEVMVLMAGEDLPHRAIREQISSSLDLIVHVERLRDGSRKVISVSEVLPALKDGRVLTRDIFSFRQEGVSSEGKVLGKLCPTGAVPGFLDKLCWAGVEVSESVFEGGGLP